MIGEWLRHFLSTKQRRISAEELHPRGYFYNPAQGGNMQPLLLNAVAGVFIAEGPSISLQRQPIGVALR